MLKGILYVVIVLITIWALNSIKIDNLFKKNTYYQARVLYLIVSLSLSYLVVNFLYDFFEYTKLI